MQDLIPINIVIGDRSYRIRIKPEDEGTVRATLKTINDKIIEFKTQFAGKTCRTMLPWSFYGMPPRPGPNPGMMALLNLPPPSTNLRNSSTRSWARSGYALLKNLIFATHPFCLSDVKNMILNILNSSFHGC